MCLCGSVAPQQLSSEEVRRKKQKKLTLGLLQLLPQCCAARTHHCQQGGVPVQRTASREGSHTKHCRRARLPAMAEDDGIEVVMIEAETEDDRQPNHCQPPVQITATDAGAPDESAPQPSQTNDCEIAAETPEEEAPVSGEQLATELATEPAAAVVPEAEVAGECVKVAVRVRPLSAKEVSEGSSQCVSFPTTGQIVIVSAQGGSSPSGRWARIVLVAR